MLQVQLDPYSCTSLAYRFHNLRLSENESSATPPLVAEQLPILPIVLLLSLRLQASRLRTLFGDSCTQRNTPAALPLPPLLLQRSAQATRFPQDAPAPHPTRASPFLPTRDFLLVAEAAAPHPPPPPSQAIRGLLHAHLQIAGRSHRASCGCYGHATVGRFLFDQANQSLPRSFRRSTVAVVQADQPQTSGTHLGCLRPQRVC